MERDREGPLSNLEIIHRHTSQRMGRGRGYFPKRVGHGSDSVLAESMLRGKGTWNVALPLARFHIPFPAKLFPSLGQG